MHARDSIDIAGIVAFHGPQLITGARALNPASLEQYWTTSKCRCQSWNRAFKFYSTNPVSGESMETRVCGGLLATLEEVFTSEILTRVWTTVLVAHDRRVGAGIDEPLARSVFDSHMEVRRRALKSLLDASDFSTSQVVAMNRLRRKAERWSDMLIGGLLTASGLAEFAVDAERARDFAVDLADRQGHPGGRHAWRLTLVALHDAFRTSRYALAANPDTNARITASILGCFPGELFDSTGVLKTLWLTRLSAVTTDAQGLIDEFLDVAAAGPRPSPRRRL